MVTQIIGIRLSKQVRKATAAVQKGVQLYNAVIGIKSGSLLCQNIAEKDALIPSSPVFFWDRRQSTGFSIYIISFPVT